MQARLNIFLPVTGVLSRTFLHILAFFVCFFLLPAQAATPEDAWYQAEVPVASYTQEAWEKALAPALQKVLARMTTHPDMTQVAAIRTALSKPSGSIQTYTYRIHTHPLGQPALFLHIYFSPTAVDRLLRILDQSPVIEENTEAPQATHTPTPQVISLIVSGIENPMDYTALMEYLHHMQEVKEVYHKQTRGDRVLLLVTIQGDITGLSQQIEAGDKLVREPIADTTALLSYRWVTDASNTAITTALLSEEVARAP